MNVTLYKYSAERNRVDKSGYLTLVLAASGEFKSDTSILNPTLILTLPVGEPLGLEDGNGNEVDLVGILPQNLDFNYFYIMDFGRYYYVTSIVVSSNRVIVVTGSVDPLYSHMSGILSNPAMIARNEFRYNPLLRDDERPFNEIVIKEVSQIATLYPFSWGNNGKCVAIATLVKPFTEIPSVPANHMYPPLVPSSYDPNWYNLPAIDGRYHTQGSRQSGLYVATLDYMEKLGEYVLFNEKYDNNLIAVCAFPFQINTPQGSDEVDSLLYWWDEYITPFKNDDPNIDNLDPRNQVWRLKYGARNNYFFKFRGNAIIPEPSSFYDLEPFAQYELYVPFVGWITLNAHTLAGHRLSAFYSINYYDGTAVFTLYDEDSEAVVTNVNCQIGVRIDYTKSNLTAIRNQLLQQGVSLAVSSLTAILGIGASVATGQPLTAGLSLAGLIGNLTNSAVNASIASQRGANTGSVSGSNSVANPLEFFLKVTRSSPIFADGSAEHSTYLHLHGAPLRSVYRLSDLSGFTKVESVHLDNFPATMGEKSEIEASLLAGVIL